MGSGPGTDAAHASRQVEAASSYQDVLVPALMEEWAPRVADAAGVRPGDRVLDVACGTGVLTRAVAMRAGSEGAVTGLDLAPGMLAVAAHLSPELHWQQGAADALPFPDRSFDAVVSQFGLMFFPDPVAALREMMRVLAPGGRLAIAVWASLADTPAYATQVELVERLAGPTAAEALRAPFALGDAARLGELCAAAGIGGARAALQQGSGRFSSIRAMMEADLRGWLPLMGVVLEEQLIGEILREAENALRPYVTPDGTVLFASPAVLVTAEKPREP
jgi:protein-L-isoaspartate O-methyltransferase